MTENEVIERVEEEGINFMRLQFTDILGEIKNVAIPASQVSKALDEGIWFDGSSIEGFVRIQESDMRLDPDPDTFAILPFENRDHEANTARMICDVTQPNGDPFIGDPRYALHRAIARAEEMGYELNAGPEPEFFVFEKSEEGRATTITQDAGGYFDLAPKDLASDLRRDIILTLQKMGFKVEASHHEVAEGQHEIDFKFDDALTTADNIATFRMAVRAVAGLHDLHATFMPKPIAGINGSGMHTHFSLFEGDKNAFHNSDAEFNMSDVALSFMAGILEHAPAITAITNPNVNSYKRLIPGYEAPVYVAWSDINRSAQIRKPASRKPEGTRIEYRSPDPSCNPYLLLAVCLQAGLDGIEKDLEAPDPVRENIYEFTEKKRREYGIDILPENLEEAIDELEADPVIRDALGEHIFENFVDAKRAEWDEYKCFVSDWELDRYLEKF